MEEEEDRRMRRGAGGSGGGGVGGWLDRPALNLTDCLVSWVPECSREDVTWLANYTRNQTTSVRVQELPPDLGFDDNALTDIIVYGVLFVIAAAGNLTVFITLCRNRHRKSRVNLMIMHLAAADLLVTLINFPLEVGWRVTTQWIAGNLACKMFQFMRAFGLYLSSLILVCISLDRYFAIVHPLKVNDAQRRGKMMVCLAWSVAAVCSVPQSVIFHVDSHPDFSQFIQCVTFGFFRTQAEETMYNLFCLAAMYFLPLMIIIVVYFRILWEISQKSKDSAEPKRREDISNARKSKDRHRTSNKESRDIAGSRMSRRSGGGERIRLRRSDTSNIERARARTLRMTVIIVLAFVWCWTPYVVMVIWYMFDRASAEQVDRRLQDVLFIMAVSNSCVNPIVYGTYTINLRAELNRCFGRRRGRGATAGGGGGGRNSSQRQAATRRSTAGTSSAPRSTFTTVTKTSFTQVSNRHSSINSTAGAPYTSPPRPASPRPVPRGSGCVMVEIEATSSHKVISTTAEGEAGAERELFCRKMSDSDNGVQMTSLMPLPGSKVNERSGGLLQNGSAGGTLMLTAC